MSGLEPFTAMDAFKGIHCYYKTAMNKFAKLLILGAVLLAIFALGHGFYYSPNGDSGLSLASTSQGATAISIDAGKYPSRLLIPELSIDVNVQHVGVTKNGNMAAPSNFIDVSWYKFGTVPGYRGSAVMAGHQDNAMGLDGVFKHLEDLELGDDVYVIGQDGKRLHFKVIDKQIYDYNDPSPLKRIFNADDGVYLNLITCAGKWLQVVKTNDQRLVVYTELVKD